MTLTIPWLERKRLVRKLEEAHDQYQRFASLEARMDRYITLDEYFAVCVEIGEFNRAHPELAIAKLVDGRIPLTPMLGAPAANA